MGMRFLNMFNLKNLLIYSLIATTSGVVIYNYISNEKVVIKEAPLKQKYHLNKGIQSDNSSKKRTPSSTNLLKEKLKPLNRISDKIIPSKKKFSTTTNKKISRKPSGKKPIYKMLQFAEEVTGDQKVKKKANESFVNIGQTREVTLKSSEDSEKIVNATSSNKIAPTIAPKIRGTIPALNGLITYNNFNLISKSYAAATTCTGAKVQLFDTLTKTVLSDNPISFDDLSTETKFEFDPMDLGLDTETPTKYMLTTTGCDQSYERIVTSFYKLQDLSPTSTLISKIYLSSITINPEDLDGEKLDTIIEEVQSTILQTDNPEDAYATLNASPAVQTAFQDAFNGESHTKLADAAPDVTTINVPASLNEKVSSIFSVTSEHWDSTYVTGYQWVLNGVTQSNSPSWTYTPSANALRTVNIDLIIGKKKTNPDNDVDTTLPHHIFNYTLAIADDFPTIAPNISINAGTTDPTPTRDINLDLSTGATSGATYVNCESFSSMAITEDSNVPSSGDFTINCSNATTQILPVHLYRVADGTIDVNIWARDINGDISPKKTVTLVMDTTGPVFNITSPSAFYRADTSNTFNWTVSDSNLNSANNMTIELYDGTSWTQLTNHTVTDGLNSNSTFSQSYLLPNLISATSKIRLSLMDTAGNTTTTESALFEIRKPTIAILPLSYDWTLVPNLSLGSNNGFTVSNTGNAATKNCTAPSLTGANISEFEIVTDTCSTNALNPASSCITTIRPKPTTKGVKNATLTWTCDLDIVTSTLTYTSANNLPVMGANSAETTLEDTALSFTVNNATDIDSDTLTYSVVTSPSNGVLSNCLNSDGDLNCDYTPNPNYYGADSFTFKANDGTADSATVTTVNITVTSVNDKPVIGANQNIITNEDTLAAFTLNSATDVDIPVQTLSYKVITAPTNGTLSNCIDTTTYKTDIICDYTPSANYNGGDSFTYEAYDSITNSVATATVSITVNSVNDAPTLASGQTETIAEDNTLNFTLQLGADIDGDPLTYPIVSTTTNGALTCSGTPATSCSYVPSLNFNGADSFTYKVNDGALDSPTRTVNITVTPVNDQPTLVATQSVTTTEDAVLNFTLNSGADIDGDTLTYIIVSTPSTGTLSCTGGTSNACSYTPVADDNGVYTFTYKVNDGTVDSAIATVTVNVSPLNDAPVMVGNQSLATNEDTAFSITLSGATDIDIPAQTLQYKLITAPTNGVLSACITSGTYSTDVICTYTPGLNFNGSDSFTYRANDTVTDSSTDSTVSITINAVNDAPTLAATQSVSTNEDTALTFDLTAGSDIESSPLTYIKLTNTTNGTISCTGGTSRSCTYTPNGNYNGADSFTYRVSDGSLNSTTATVNITVNAINDAPVMVGNQSLATNEDTAFSITLSGATDIDIPAQTLQYKLITAPTNGVLSACITSGTYSTDVICTYTPGLNFNGSDSFTYRANDTVTDSSTDSTVSITINAVNDAPTLAATQSVSTNEDTALTFDLTAGSDIESSPLTYIKLTNTTNGTISCTGGTSRSCTYTPNGNYNGADSFTYRVSDGSLNSSTATVNITVNAINDAPVIGANQAIAVTEDIAKNFTITSATDVDIPAQTLQYRLVTAPTNGVLSACITTASYIADVSCTYTPNSNFNGVDTIVYKAYDGITDSVATATITFNVAAVNDAPTLASTQAVAVVEDTLKSFNLTSGSDVDGDALNYLILTTPTNGTLSCTGGTSRVCNYTPNLNYNGSDTFTYKVNDGSLDSTLNTVTLTVSAVNDAPTLAATQAVTVTEDTLKAFNLTTGSDVDGDTLSYVIVTNPTTGTLSCTGGTSTACTYTPVANDNGSYTFTYRVNDGSLNSTVNTVTLNITAVNDAPVAVANQAITTDEDVAKPFNLTVGSDIEGDTLSYIIVTNPTNGSLSCTGGTSTACTYTPNANYNGADSFSYKVNDGALDSTTNTIVAITVNSINDAPQMAANQSFTTDDNVNLNITLSNATDIDGDALTYKIVTPPSNGTLSSCITTGSYGSDLTCVYDANTNFNGVDTFTFIANDSTTDAPTVETVSITVTDKTVPSAPAVILAHSIYRKTTSTSLTATTCSDTPFILINESTQPTSGAAGWQACTTTASALSYTLANTNQGTHNLKVWAKDAYNNVSTASTALTVIYDTVLPSLAVTNPGVRKGGQTATIDWTLTELNINNTKLYTIDYWTGSTWSNISTTKTATTGPHTTAPFSTSWSVPSLNRTDIKLRVAITDLAGNTSSAESTTFEIDSIAPSVAISTPLANTYHQTALTITGTCETGIDVDLTGDIPASFSTSCTAGTFSQLVNLSSGDGNKTITTTQVDPAGNSSAVSRTFIRDEVAPAIAKTSGISPDFTKNNQPNAWGGTCEGNYTISVTGDETTSFACTSGTWSWTPSAKTVDGTYTYNLAQTDGAGNTSTPLSVSWQRDATPPVFTASSPTTILTGQTIGYTSNLDSVTLSGTCEGTNTINISGAQATAISCSASSWTWTTNTFGTDAVRSFTLTQSDAAGNTSAMTLNWTRDTTGPALAIDNNLLKNNDGTVTFTGSCEIGLTVNVTGTDTSSTTCPAGTWTWTSAAQASDAKRSYTFTQTATVSPFNSTVVSGEWIRETNAPTISAFTTTAPNPTVSSFISTSMTATSQNTEVSLSHFCIKSIDGTAPAVGDSCWVAVNSPSVGLPLAQTLNLSNFSYLLGWVPRNYDVFLWVKDEAENISTNTATISTDKLNITFTPAIAPTISDVIAASTDLSTIPPTVGHSQAAAGTDLYVRWKAADDSALPANAISIYYTEDEINFTAVSGGVGIAANHNNCPSITLAANEGCFKWTGGSPYNTAYKVRVKVTDLGAMSAQSISNPVNSDKIKILAGNTESGLGGSAQTALFYTRREGSESDPGTLVVTDKGNVYVADYKRGILTVDPTDGKQKIFISQTGTSSGDGGPATSATLNYAVKIALDFQGRLLILDRNRIRRVDLNMANPTIDTIIGGGADTGDTVANPLDVSMYSHSTNSWTARGAVFFAMPNGDIYFQSDYALKGWTTPTYRMRIYSAATGQVTSKYFSGTGDTYDPTMNVMGCQMQHVGYGYNPANSQITHIEAILKHHSSYTTCPRTDAVIGERYTRTAFDPTSYTSIPASTADSYRYYRYFHTTGMDGKMYVTIDRNYINRVNEDGTFTRVLGNGSRGLCADGTANTSCAMDIQDMFITSSGKIYFLEGGQVRTIDDSGNVVTLFGQRRSYGNGVNALNARFDYINTAIKLNDEKIIVGDNRGYFIKEFSIAGNINTIAGDGNYRSYVDINLDAKSQGFYDGSWITADRATGEVFMRDYAYGRYVKLNRTTSKWDRIIGFGATNYWEGDGLAGMDIRNNGNQSYGLPIGHDGTNFLTVRMKYNSAEAHWEDFMWKLYDSSDAFRQSHVGGVNDANTYLGGYEGMSATGSVAATSKMPYYSYVGMPTWDAAGNRWVFMRNVYGSSTNARQIWSVVKGGNITHLATLPRNIDQSYIYRKEATTDYLYYCAYGRLYKHNITTNTDLGQLSWPINNLYCRGLSLEYSAARNSLIFPFEQNGLFGVAEYYLP